jgi:hypothetical protein
MDFLTPELLRILAPGRVAVIHCKDRVIEGSRSGLGFQTISAFADDVKAHFKKHGFAHIGTKIIVTDVVRENNQTYRLGWTEQCKDGSRMGVGLYEYLHIFRKPQTDRSRGYADTPVVKLKRTFDPEANRWEAFGPRSDTPAETAEGYSRARWQLDANGFARSDGNRFVTPAELASLPHKGVFRRWRGHSTT